MSLRLLVLVALLTITARITSGQSVSPKSSASVTQTPKQNDDFSAWSIEALLHERDTLGQQIPDLANQIGWINDAIAKRTTRDQLVALHKSTEDIDKDINQTLSYASMAGVQLSELDARLVQHQNTMEDKRNRRATIDAELTRRLDLERPKQNFKLEMSAVFAFLVGMVILGFFVMAYRDEQVRREIFAGQSGIQFVTLFSLVIAIILFGIIDVLEGKELAALLGGLSGYILGRSTPTGIRTKDNAAPPPQPALPPVQPPQQGEAVDAIPNERPPKQERPNDALNPVLQK
jgi:hypothetical protein